MQRLVTRVLVATLVAAGGLSAQQQPTNRDVAARTQPTHADVRYGPHERNVMDVWLAESHRPTPVIVSIHDGGFRAGNKNVDRGILEDALASGISVVAITYRLSDQAIAPAQFHDAARAIQFIRHNAREWNLDPERMAATGASAGAGLSLWLGFHDDLADPSSPDKRAGHRGQRAHGGRSGRGVAAVGDGLPPLQIRYALNYGLSGIPFWQGGEISSFAPPMMPAALQTQLRPYTYTAWRAAHEKGLPVVRAMVLENQEDPAMYEADTQFLFGLDLLVAPLVKGSESWRASFFPEERPGTERVGHRYVLGQIDWNRVYIPAGEWIHYWNQKKYRGPAWQYFRPEDGLEMVLVRGGAILPLGPVVEYDGQKPLDALTLEVYPYGENSYRLYEDDGRSYAYERGEYATTEFAARETSGGIEFEIGLTRGAYAGKPAMRTYIPPGRRHD